PIDAPEPDAPPPPDAPAPPPDAPLAPDAPVDAAPDAPPDAAPDAPPPDAASPDAPAPDAACEIDLLATGDFESTTGTGSTKDITPWINIVGSGSRTYLVLTATELGLIGAHVADGTYAADLGGEDNAANGLYIPIHIPFNVRSLALTG